MIVDSHAHYAHGSFSNTFRYLSWENTWVLKEGTLDDLLAQMEERGIHMSVEPGISLDFNEKILASAKSGASGNGWMRTAPGPALWPWAKRASITTIPVRSSSGSSSLCGFSTSSDWRESTGFR